MARWITKNCKANGVDVHYRRTGGDKPPLVLLHGLMLSGACWIPLARELEEDYDVVMPDARGHGHSSAPGHGYYYNNFAADVVSLIETLGLTRPVLLGHSMGGMTAALVGSLQPRQLRGLILADPTFLTPQFQEKVHKSDVAEQHRRILNQSKADYLAKAQVRHSHRTQEIIELFAEARFQTSIDAFEILTPPNPNYVQLIKTLAMPSLLVIGDAGSIVSVEMATELTKLNPHLQVAQIAEAGHAIPFDQPEHFLAVVQTFLRSIKS
ncbi:MAG: alpha/beta hydrolase [Gammaproteobacteria bacterium]|nr:alpha/beta hydrolase [Gammaproteobacteria bacterium]